MSDRRTRLSIDRVYRYSLWRDWGGEGYAMFIGLNPSTADETNDDPTIRRCVAYSKAWGYGALCMTNLFAFRATNPEVMKRAADPVGMENDATLVEMAKAANLVVAAWGTHGSHLNRAAFVADLLSPLHCLKLTKDGYPAHPLYLKKDLTPVLMS